MKNKDQGRVKLYTIQIINSLYLDILVIANYSSYLKKEKSCDPVFSNDDSRGEMFAMKSLNVCCLLTERTLSDPTSHMRYIYIIYIYNSMYISK